MAYYKDLREHITALEAKGKLIRIKREINKDTELMPLVRWQFRGLPEEERKAFLFENVVDVKGRHYDIPVLVASHAASSEVYAIGMMCDPDKIMQKWTEAQLHPITPEIVKTGPVHEEIHMGDSLLDHGGLDEFPIPISTPGFDNGPYLTCANWVTKDPETGIRNIGNYRAMIKSKTRTGIRCVLPHHLRMHWDKCKKERKPLQAAIVIGASPAIGYVATIKLPYETDEYDIAGGLAGEAIKLVKCKTVDIEVPAAAEMVFEGELPTDSMEWEAPFGEFAGYMGKEKLGPHFNITCITHRRNPIYNAFISQFPPSESSKLKQIGNVGTLYKILRYNLGLPVLDVGLHESCGTTTYCVIKMKKSHPAQPWQALNGVAAIYPQYKIIIVVDEDIDPLDADSVNWAMAYRTQPHRDIRIIQGITAPVDPSVGPSESPERETEYPSPSGASALLIDATIKWPYPPVALPKKEFMEKAKKIWEEEGLPKLNVKTPWYGYSLGDWTEENKEEAELALQGEHYQTGEKMVKKRVKL